MTVFADTARTIRLLRRHGVSVLFYFNDLDTSTGPLTVNDYKILIDHGWRRCGTLVYKPVNKKTCCPAYTIRCDAEAFRVSKSQKKVLRVMAEFLNKGEVPNAVKKSNNASYPTGCGGDKGDSAGDTSKHSEAVKPKASGDSEMATTARDPTTSSRSNSARKKRWKALQDRMARRAEASGIPFEELMRDYLIRRQRRLDKNKPKELEHYLSLVQPKEKAKHFLDVRLCRSSPRSTEFDLTFEEEFRLYSDYQITIHHDDATGIEHKGFIKFLVKSPLVSVHDSQAEAAGAPQFGSYHQQYWLDGKRLIAVGVVDLLPGCLSSVYLFYDPKFAFLHLGTYSALREIALVRHFHRTYGPSVASFADFTQYYMGFYIHSCVKMRYKALFSPSYLACPETYKWVPVEKCQRLLDQGKYARFAELADQQEEDPDSAVLLLPFSERLASMLPAKNFTIEGDVIITTVGIAASVIKKQALQVAREWVQLVGSTGTMRINYVN
uniref:Arginyl-tRNA--protein transferase 1 n=1 Tax=Mesocestoides corti TaxID=53468 RepID=A0A5K3FHY6_MESCO